MSHPATGRRTVFRRSQISCCPVTLMRRDDIHLLQLLHVDVKHKMVQMSVTVTNVSFLMILWGVLLGHMCVL